VDAVFDLIIKDRACTGVAVFAVSEPDITLALQQPWSRSTTILRAHRPMAAGKGNILIPRLRHFPPFAQYVREEAKLPCRMRFRSSARWPRSAWAWWIAAC